MNPKISVIIPFFNAAKTLQRAIESVFTQEEDFELILVNDGSLDDSAPLVHSYLDDSSIRLFGKENKGVSTARNVGAKEAKGDWLLFLDADDELLPGKIEGQMALVSRDTPFVVGNSVHVFSDGRKHLRKSDRDVWKGLIRSKLGDTCANLWNRQFLVEVGAWDERLASSQEYD
ncbi:MAG: glycosyltransferase, partial [Algoriphagus sp.]|nr:glycosyltransferase [Algoriphagus sp.]